MVSWQLHQEYPRFPEEAFIKSGNPVFDIDLLNTFETVEPDVGFLHAYSNNVVEFRPTENGELRIWEFPDTESVYVIGADVAEGLAHGDYSSAHVISATNGYVVAHWHGHVEPDIFGEMMAQLGWWYNQALVGIESNNHGLTTLKAAQKLGYRNLYRQRRLSKVTPQATDTMGWRMTVSSKPLAIDELAGSLRNDDLQIYCELTVAELKTFVRKANGKMQGSPYDDRTISLAIANQMLKYVWLPEYRGNSTVPKNTLLWWEQHLMSAQSANKVPIGSHNVRSRLGR